MRSKENPGTMAGAGNCDLRAGEISSLDTVFATHSQDLRDTDFDGLLDLRQHIRRLWPAEERARHATERIAEAAKRKLPRPADDRTAEVMVGGLASVLLRKDLSVWLTLDLTECWNECRVLDPLPSGRVRQLCNKAAARELKRRPAA